MEWSWAEGVAVVFLIFRQLGGGREPYFLGGTA